MSDEEFAQWDRGNIRGLKRRRFVGTEKDADGNEINVYEADDDEWGNTVPVYEDDAERLYHLARHRSVYDPNCKFCHQYRER
jgi:hypothetical protein